VGGSQWLMIVMDRLRISQSITVPHGSKRSRNNSMVRFKSHRQIMFAATALVATVVRTKAFGSMAVCQLHQQRHGAAAAVMVVAKAKGRCRLASTRSSTPQQAIGTPATSYDDGQRPFQITTPIYYVNDKPHIGHAYTSTGTCIMCVRACVREYSLCDSRPLYDTPLEAEDVFGSNRSTLVYVCFLTSSSNSLSLFSFHAACDVIARFMRLSGRDVFF
jgi:hypothetical protein